jgi:hypothetical protein
VTTAAAGIEAHPAAREQRAGERPRARVIWGGGTYQQRPYRRWACPRSTCRSGGDAVGTKVPANVRSGALCSAAASEWRQRRISRSSVDLIVILPLLQTGLMVQEGNESAWRGRRPRRGRRGPRGLWQQSGSLVRLTVTTGTPRARLPSGFPAWWPSTIIDGAPPARSRGPPAGHRGCGGRVRAGHGRAAQPRWRAARHRL